MRINIWNSGLVILIEDVQVIKDENWLNFSPSLASWTSSMVAYLIFLILMVLRLISLATYKIFENFFQNEREIVQG